MATVSSWAEIHTSAWLLRVPPEHLEGAVTRRVVVSPRVLGRWEQSGHQGAHLPRSDRHLLWPPGDTLWPGLKTPARGKCH